MVNYQSTVLSALEEVENATPSPWPIPANASKAYGTPRGRPNLQLCWPAIAIPPASSISRRCWIQERTVLTLEDSPHRQRGRTGPPDSTFTKRWAAAGRLTSIRDGRQCAREIVVNPSMQHDPSWRKIVGMERKKATSLKPDTLAARGKRPSPRWASVVSSVPVPKLGALLSDRNGQPGRTVGLPVSATVNWRSTRSSGQRAVRHHRGGVRGFNDRVKKGQMLAHLISPSSGTPLPRPGGTGLGRCQGVANRGDRPGSARQSQRLRQ